MEIEGYETLGTIGTGGMGVVYLARERKLDRLVALKVLSEDLTNQPEFRVRFLREIRVLARLKHSNLVPVFEGGIQGKTPHFSMAYIQGCNLGQVLKVLRTKRDRGEEWFSVKALADAAGLSMSAPSYIETVLMWVIELGEALVYVHRRGVLHLDLKPSNVLLTPDGGPVLLDFGVAQILKKSGGEDGFMGTPAYMAPERLLSQGKDVGKFSDAYSLAVILFELLTLELPVPGKGISEICRNHRNAVLLNPILLQPKIPLELAQILRKALAKEPSVSYLDVESFIADLRRFLQFEPLHLPGIPLEIRIKRFFRTKRIPLVKGVLVLLLGLGLFALFARGIHWRDKASQVEKEAEVQAFSLLALAKKALGRSDYVGCLEYLIRAKEMSPSAALQRNVQDLQEQLRLEEDQGIRLLKAKVHSGDGDGIGNLLRSVRPLIDRDSEGHKLVFRALSLERDHLEKNRILSLDRGVRKAALFRLACDLSKGGDLERGRLASLSKVLREDDPPFEALLCLFAGQWAPWEREIKWGIRGWALKKRIVLLFLLAFDPKAPFANLAKAENQELFDLRLPFTRRLEIESLPLREFVQEAEVQGALPFGRRLSAFQRFYEFYSGGAFCWPQSFHFRTRTWMALRLQLRLAWGIPLELKDGLFLLNNCIPDDSHRVLCSLYWARSDVSSRIPGPLLDELQEKWGQQQHRFHEEQILCLLALWNPRQAWDFFQGNGLPWGVQAEDFAIFLKLLPASLTQAFEEEVNGDPMAPRFYRKGIRLWEKGVTIPPLFAGSKKERDPRILADAAFLIQNAGPGEIPLLRRLASTPFPWLKKKALNKLQSLRGK